MYLRIREPQAWILPILIAFASINGFIKAFTGIRYGPLLIDVALLLILVTSIAILASKDHLRIGFIDLLAVLFLIVAIFEMFNSNIPSFQAGLEGFRKFAFMIIGFFIGRYAIRSITFLKRFVQVFLIISFLISLYGIKQYIFPSALDYRLIDLSTGSRATYLMGGHIRAFSTLAGPFHLGIYLACSILLLIAITLRFRGFLIWSFILGIPQLVALLMTVTKSNWAGLLAGVLVLILLASRRVGRALWRITILGLIAIGLLFVTYRISQSIAELKTLNQGLQAFIDPLKAPTFLFRLDLWRSTVIPLMKEGFWFGYGTGSAGEGLSNLFANTNSLFFSAHNLFFKVQIELGVFGLILFLTFLILTVIFVWRTNRHLKDPFLCVIRDWTLAFTIAVLVAGLVGSILDAYPANLIFWLLLGISSRLYRFESRNPRPGTDPKVVLYPN